jgi:multiple sugar transport system substrate-binding protein
MRFRTVAACAAAVLTAVAATGCGSSDDSADGPVKLTYWAWAPGLDKVVELWNETHPDIQVTVKEQAAGDDLVTKTITAAKAGNAPDLMQAEYQALPTLVSNDVLADISGQVADAEAEFPAGVWQQVTLGTDAVYALPQDSGPMISTTGRTSSSSTA